MQVKQLGKNEEAIIAQNAFVSAHKKHLDPCDCSENSYKQNNSMAI